MGIRAKLLMTSRTGSTSTTSNRILLPHGPGAGGRPRPTLAWIASLLILAALAAAAPWHEGRAQNPTAEPRADEAAASWDLFATLRLQLSALPERQRVRAADHALERTDAEEGALWARLLAVLPPPASFPLDLIDEEALLRTGVLPALAEQQDFYREQENLAERALLARWNELGRLPLDDEGARLADRLGGAREWFGRTTNSKDLARGRLEAIHLLYLASVTDTIGEESEAILRALEDARLRRAEAEYEADAAVTEWLASTVNAEIDVGLTFLTAAPGMAEAALESSDLAEVLLSRAESPASATMGEADDQARMLRALAAQARASAERAGSWLAARSGNLWLERDSFLYLGPAPSLADPEVEALRAERRRIAAALLGTLERRLTALDGLKPLTRKRERLLGAVASYLDWESTEAGLARLAIIDRIKAEARDARDTVAVLRDEIGRLSDALDDRRASALVELLAREVERLVLLEEALFEAESGLLLDFVPQADDPRLGEAAADWEADVEDFLALDETWSDWQTMWHALVEADDASFQALRILISRLAPIWSGRMGLVADRLASVQGGDAYGRFLARAAAEARQQLTQAREIRLEGLDAQVRIAGRPELSALIGEMADQSWNQAAIGAAGIVDLERRATALSTVPQEAALVLDRGESGPRRLLGMLRISAALAIPWTLSGSEAEIEGSAEVDGERFVLSLSGAPGQWRLEAVERRKSALPRRFGWLGPLLVGTAHAATPGGQKEPEWMRGLPQLRQGDGIPDAVWRRETAQYRQGPHGAWNAVTSGAQGAGEAVIKNTWWYTTVPVATTCIGALCGGLLGGPPGAAAGGKAGAVFGAKAVAVSAGWHAGGGFIEKGAEGLTPDPVVHENARLIVAGTKLGFGVRAVHQGLTGSWESYKAFKQSQPALMKVWSKASKLKTPLSQLLKQLGRQQKALEVMQSAGLSGTQVQRAATQVRLLKKAIERHQQLRKLVEGRIGRGKSVAGGVKKSLGALAILGKRFGNLVGDKAQFLAKRKKDLELANALLTSAKQTANQAMAAMANASKVAAEASRQVSSAAAAASTVVGAAERAATTATAACGKVTSVAKIRTLVQAANKATQAVAKFDIAGQESAAEGICKAATGVQHSAAKAGADAFAQGKQNLAAKAQGLRAKANALNRQLAGARSAQTRAQTLNATRESERSRALRLADGARSALGNGEAQLAGLSSRLDGASTALAGAKVILDGAQTAIVGAEASIGSATAMRDRALEIASRYAGDKAVHVSFANLQTIKLPSRAEFTAARKELDGAAAAVSKFVTVDLPKEVAKLKPLRTAVDNACALESADNLVAGAKSLIDLAAAPVVRRAAAAAAKVEACVAALAMPPPPQDKQASKGPGKDGKPGTGKGKSDGKAGGKGNGNGKGDGDDSGKSDGSESGDRPEHVVDRSAGKVGATGAGLGLGTGFEETYDPTWDQGMGKGATATQIAKALEAGKRFGHGVPTGGDDRGDGGGVGGTGQQIPGSYTAPGVTAETGGGEQVTTTPYPPYGGRPPQGPGDDISRFGDPGSLMPGPGGPGRPGGPKQPESHPPPPTPGGSGGHASARFSPVGTWTGTFTEQSPTRRCDFDISMSVGAGLSGTATGRLARGADPECGAGYTHTVTVVQHGNRLEVTQENGATIPYTIVGANRLSLPETRYADVTISTDLTRR